MKQKIAFSILFILFVFAVQSQNTKPVKQVKNLIVLIPDGTSLSSVSIARWYQWCLNPDQPKLAIDPFICGTVRTHSSNAPIGDSAPTTSCYMTGYPSLTGYVSTYPPADVENDIYPVEPSKAYQPLATIMEAARINHKKSIGLVFTCEFTHATPADCAAHSYKRNRYDWIAPQMVHNGLDVVMGGGTSLLSEKDEAYLHSNGYGVFKNDLKGMRAYKGDKMWALFKDRDMSYDLDRDPSKEPSIEEMTQQAIEKLSKNQQGFVLMVEGSKIDWAAHGNDPVGIITEFLAFDKACKTALDFAIRDGETAVVIVPDHGNSGFSLGSRHCTGYDKLTKKDLFDPISKVKLTAAGFTEKLNEQPYSAVQQIFREYAGFELSSEELNALNHCKEYKNSPIPEAERTDKDISSSLYSGSLSGFISKLITSKSCFGFTTGGHTGEEVFLAAYHPHQTLPLGMNTNIELNHYLTAVLGISGELDPLTETIFIPHKEALKGYSFELIQPADKDKGNPTLVVKHKKKQLTIQPNTNIVKLGKKEELRLNSVIVYVDVNQTFYLPKELVDYLK